MLCNSCGNLLVHESCSPVCLVCQHTGRDSGRAMEAHARGLAAALDATYAALGSMTCQSCNGTGRYLARPCPDCHEPEERE